MPKYTELQSEPYWNQEKVSPEMGLFFTNLSRETGIPKTHMGAKGDNASGHMRGSHRSQRWLLNSRYCTNRTYTVDRNLDPALLDYIAGIDITPNSRQQMLELSRNLDRAVRAGLIEEVYEWYGNTDNDTRVDGYNNVQNRVASSDSSHLWHVHITIKRAYLRSAAFFNKLQNALLGRPIGSEPTPTERKPTVFACTYTGDPKKAIYVSNGIEYRHFKDWNLFQTLVARGVIATKEGNTAFNFTDKTAMENAAGTERVDS